MIVCHCHQVTDRQIRTLVREGATTCRAVARACRAGAASRCGTCRPAVADVIEDELASACAASVPGIALPEALPVG